MPFFENASNVHFTGDCQFNEVAGDLINTWGANSQRHSPPTEPGEDPSTPRDMKLAGSQSTHTGISLDKPRVEISFADHGKVPGAIGTYRINNPGTISFGKRGQLAGLVVDVRSDHAIITPPDDISAIEKDGAVVEATGGESLTITNSGTISFYRHGAGPIAVVTVGPDGTSVEVTRGADATVAWCRRIV